MIKKLAAIAFMSATALSFAGAAQAEDIPATPMNKGPMMMHGMGPVGDIANVGLAPVNMIAQPVTAAGDSVSGSISGPKTAMAEPAPMMHHRHHHKHMMMKKKMMKKKMM